jgi:predicted regulator of Ras-like GTPase activity (Roadblock/LC7/MglB family)
MVLDRVTRVPGVRGALLASAADGLVVAEQLMDGVDGQAAAAEATGW